MSKKYVGKNIYSNITSDPINKWLDEYLKKEGITDYKGLAQALIMVENPNTNGYDDVMQSSESAGYPAPGYLTGEASVKQGCKHLSQVLKGAEKKGVDVWGAMQSYNFGTAYVDWLSKRGGINTIELAEEYSLTVVAPSLGNTTGSTYSYVNEVSKKNGKTYLYWNGGNFQYSDMVKQYVKEIGSDEPNPNPNPEKEPPKKDPQPPSQKPNFSNFLKELEEMAKKIDNMLRSRVFYQGDNYSNQTLTLYKEIGNSYIVKPNFSVLDMLPKFEANPNHVEKPNNKPPTGNYDTECDKKIKKFVDELEKTNKIRHFNYENIRPNEPLNTSTYADCSSFIGWCLRDIYPKIWNDGYLHTGTIFDYFTNMGTVVWKGSIKELSNKKLEKGDILEFSDNPSFGAGLNSHIGAMTSDTDFCDMNGNGNMIRKWDKVLEGYYNYQQYLTHACIIKIYKKSECIESKPKGDYKFPLNGKFTGVKEEGQQFGVTSFPREGGYYHNGVDFGSATYDISTIYACVDGEVSAVGWKSGIEGHVVIWDGKYNFVCQEFTNDTSTIKVKLGQKVKKGDIIGYKDSSAFHMHFGATTKKDFYKDAYSNSFGAEGGWVDPINIISNGKCKGSVVGSCTY